MDERPKLPPEEERVVRETYQALAGSPSVTETDLDRLLDQIHARDSARSAPGKIFRFEAREVVENCPRALEAIARARAAGSLTPAQAQSFEEVVRDSVDARLGHHLQRFLEHLANGAEPPEIAEGTRLKDEAFREIKRRLDRALIALEEPDVPSIARLVRDQLAVGAFTKRIEGSTDLDPSARRLLQDAARARADGDLHRVSNLERAFGVLSSHPREAQAEIAKRAGTELNALARGHALVSSEAFLGALQNAARSFDDARLDGARKQAQIGAPKLVGHGEPRYLFDDADARGKRAFIKYFEMDLTLREGGKDRKVTAQVLRPLGDDCSMDIVLALERDDISVVFKRGETRAANLFNLGKSGAPIVQLEKGEGDALSLREEVRLTVPPARAYGKGSFGIPGGRNELEGVDADAAAGHELWEELGLKALHDSPIKLGAPLATSAAISGEFDNMYCMWVRPGSGVAALGDGAGMEVPGLIGPATTPLRAAQQMMKNGEINSGTRGYVMLERALEQHGYIALIDRWIWDLPPEIQGRYSPPGLTLGIDPRKHYRDSGKPAKKAEPKAPDAATLLAQRINGVVFDAARTQVVDLPNGDRLYDGMAVHAVVEGNGNAQLISDKVHLNQIQVTARSEAKVVEYVRDEARGLLVRMRPTLRLAHAAKKAILGDSPKVKDQNLEIVGLDVTRVPLSLEPDDPSNRSKAADRAVQEALGDGGGLVPLARSNATPGMSNFEYHLYAKKRDAIPEDAKPGEWMPIEDAIALCRRFGEAESATEFALSALLPLEGWCGSLRMWKSDLEAQLKDRA
jgi:hypothetical protein